MVGQKSTKAQSVFFHIFSCLLGFIMVYPLLWLLMSSFKSNDTLFCCEYTFAERFSDSTKQKIPHSFIIFHVLRENFFLFSTVPNGSFFIDL